MNVSVLTKSQFSCFEKEKVDNFKDFDKPLAGEYKCVMHSADGSNHAKFTVTAGSANFFEDFFFQNENFRRPRLPRQAPYCSAR